MTEKNSEQALREMRSRDRERMARLAAQDAASVVVANTTVSVINTPTTSCDTSSSSSSSGGDCSF